jgi:polar amino acid transport system substrate-binding protein
MMGKLGAPRTRQHLLLLVGVLGALMLASQGAGQDQKRPLAGRPPLVWGADCDGGVPYVVKEADDDKKRPDEPDGPVTGVEADLRDALERELGCRIVFKQLKFDNLLIEVNQGRCDFAMNGLEITPGNQDRALFTKPYYVYQQQMVVRAAEKRFTTLKEAKELGMTAGTLQGTVAARLLEPMFGQAHFRQYDDQDGLYRDLRDRQTDLVVLDLPAALYYAAPDPDLNKFNQHVKGLRLLGPPFAPGYYGIAVKTGNTELAGHLNAAIDRLRKSGELKKIFVKWDLWNADQYELYEGVEASSGGERQIWTIDRFMPLLLRGAYYTVLITILGFAVAIAIGLPVALMRIYGAWPLRYLATGYVEFFRGIPVLLLLYFLYYGFGQFSSDWGWEWLKLDPYVAAVLGFGINYAAYEAEIYRAGIGSIPLGQWEAAASLGMSTPLTFRRIILPQAVRVILPPMTNDFVALFKDTSVVSILAITELSAEYQILTKSGGGYVIIGLCTALLYLVMSVPLGYLSRYLEKRWVMRSV